LRASLACGVDRPAAGRGALRGSPRDRGRGDRAGMRT